MRDAKRPLGVKRAALLDRARASAEIARRASATNELSAGNIDFALCELYRQSIRWSLRAFEAPEYEETSSVNPPTSDSWSRVDAAVLTRAVPDPALLARAQQVSIAGSAETFAELDGVECAQLADALGSIARALIEELRESERVVEALWVLRMFRIAVVGGLFGIIALALTLASDLAERQRDLAIGKPWRASSLYSTPGCHSPAQTCEESPDYFVHTQEQANPWVEFDLGAAHTISAVRVINRKDCCTERIAPLVVEVSTDQNNWKSVARHEAMFSNWLASFPPTNARWVRLRVDRTSLLHLHAVSILR